jgi:hypothetical protein
MEDSPSKRHLAQLANKLTTLSQGLDEQRNTRLETFFL